MRVLILGASGRTGTRVVAQALSQSHTVTALVRNPSTVASQPNLTLIQGTPLDRAAIGVAFTSAPQDDPIRAVVVALATSRESDNPWSKPTSPRFFIRDSVQNTIAVMKENGVSRIVVMAAFGTGKSWAQLSAVVKAMFKWSNMSLQMEDHNAVDEVLRGEGKWLQWTVARPTMLKMEVKDGQVSMVREFGENGSGIGIFDGCTRESVAKWMVDCLRETETFGKAICLAN
ncbi:NAD(P)-binding protein [Polychaeton citri CBS 116435]|uniref:NAD(P)-binding protein n=1 Tax=Polychaeton citri CBS 116435 TaxID=1314669 RepID=A0A9P4UN25_9PEZI|nr:NAD(P)-binding protein [Polychaeton citri CBS 116435]